MEFQVSALRGSRLGGRAKNPYRPEPHRRISDRQSRSRTRESSNIPVSTTGLERTSSYTPSLHD